MMRRTWRSLPLLALVGATGLTAALAFEIGAWTSGGTAEAAAPPSNACGCYRDSVGTCYCGKKAKCGCPGECEPKGCEEKRAKEIEKEIEAEAKRARDAEKKQQDEQAEKKRKEEAPPADESTDDDATATPPATTARPGADDDDEDEKVDKKKPKKKSKAAKSEKSEKSGKAAKKDVAG